MQKLLVYVYISLKIKVKVREVRAFEEQRQHKRTC